LTRLYQIQEEVRRRADETVSRHPDWPCRKGCDDCCRSLASVPRVSAAEWAGIADAIRALPLDLAAAAMRRIRESATATRPVVCPLLDTDSGACLIYDARPIACRAYGFYAERQDVLGCGRIETIGAEKPDIVWGNHAALERELEALGPAAEISGLGRRRRPAALPDSLADSLALFPGHRMSPPAGASAEAAEENAAQDQKSERLPER
jgi:Fe-S-cluster containining protein